MEVLLGLAFSLRYGDIFVEHSPAIVTSSSWLSTNFTLATSKHSSKHLQHARSSCLMRFDIGVWNDPRKKRSHAITTGEIKILLEQCDLLSYKSECEVIVLGVFDNENTHRGPSERFVLSASRFNSLERQLQTS